MPLHFLSSEATGAQPGDDVVLGGAEAHHAASVRRVRPGEAVTVGDGLGVWLEGTCAAVGPREVTVRIESRRTVAQRRPRVVLAQALAKGDRDELAIQAATELGVDAVIPWQAERSVSRWDGKEDRARGRWETIVREASKQAHRAWIPTVEPLARTRDLRESAAVSRMLVLDPGADEPLSAHELGADDSRDIVLVTGPEGGISPDELAALSGAGAHRVRLGSEVLRTSTAGTAALAVVSVRLGRW